jgi:hypothetical protein
MDVTYNRYKFVTATWIQKRNVIKMKISAETSRKLSRCNSFSRRVAGRTGVDIEICIKYFGGPPSPCSLDKSDSGLWEYLKKGRGA